MFIRLEQQAKAQAQHFVDFGTLKYCGKVTLEVTVFGEKPRICQKSLQNDCKIKCFQIFLIYYTSLFHNRCSNPQTFRIRLPSGSLLSHEHTFRNYKFPGIPRVNNRLDLKPSLNRQILWYNSEIRPKKPIWAVPRTRWTGMVTLSCGRFRTTLAQTEYWVLSSEFRKFVQIQLKIWEVSQRSTIPNDRWFLPMKHTLWHSRFSAQFWPTHRIRKVECQSLSMCMPSFSFPHFGWCESGHLTTAQQKTTRGKSSIPLSGVWPTQYWQ